MRWTHLFCLLGVVALMGCGASSGTVPVSGSVTLDGEALAGASVTFSPTSDGGKAAVGQTDDAGKFILNCQLGAGALPGDYTVAITKIDPAFMEAQGLAAMGGGATPEDPGAAYEAAEKAGVKLGGERQEEEKAPDLVPMKYTNSATSGLKATIKKDGENNLPPFALSSKE